MPNFDAPSLALTAFQLICMAGVTTFNVRYYAHPTVSLQVKIIVWLSWFFGMAGVILLPLDISVVEVGLTYNGTLHAIWELLYWSTLFFAYFGLVNVMEFEVAGQFTFQTKLLRAIKFNLTYQVAMAACGLIIFIISMIQSGLSQDQVRGVFISMANTYGSFLVIFLMGHGLVNVPRSLWKGADLQNELQRLYFFAPSYDATLYNTESELKEISKDVLDMEAQVVGLGNPENLRKCMDRIIAKMPANTIPSRGVSKATKSSRGQDICEEVNESKQIAIMANLHYKVKVNVTKSMRAKSQWDDVMQRVAELESLLDVGDSAGTGTTAKPTGSSRLAIISDAINVFWQTKAGKLVQRCLAVVAGIMSVLVLWCEVTLIFGGGQAGGPCLSPFGLILQSITAHNITIGNSTMQSNTLSQIGSKQASDWVVQIALLIPLFYMNLCLHSSLLRVKLPFLDSVAIYPRRHTDGYALCYNAVYGCRMMFSLAYNYFLILQLPGVYESTSLYAIMGQMTFVPLLGTGLTVYLPVLILLVAIVNTFDACTRLLKMIGIDTSADPNLKDANHIDVINEGKHLIKAGRRKAIPMDDPMEAGKQMLGKGLAGLKNAVKGAAKTIAPGKK